ncbi:YceI family protein [Gilvimarinus sp. SDUM040013]|uniref:YceI family protein n=1 Tax=Gilvimarinus gilvus TaxID=3058038 RepID=A0ABU4RWB8_9GAMM|nr:YceI family protein [Gilvimarinus sp. SDUM040013]MDO3387255.1 YceI family protein [Gilvimarinus sp. SDUM040013]MDX6848944.1 YceI family protein [Gilvimarinus sp. SDUM040013]
MSTTRLVLTSLITLSSIALQAAEVPLTGSYVLDASHTHVGFAVSHMGYSDVVGRFNQLEGQVKVDANGSADVEIVIDAASLDTNHNKRDDHLRSPDFFDAKQFPTITFSGQTQLNQDRSPTQFEGQLQLLGKSHPVTLAISKGKEGEDPWGLYRIGYKASTTIKRSDFDMNFMQGGIGDEVTLTINLEAVKQ